MQNWIGCLLVFCCLLTACDKNKEEVKPRLNRTVLVYMIADNSLNRWTSVNVEKMMETYKGEGNLILYIDGYEGAPRLEKLEKSGDSCRRQVIRTYEERNSASPEVLKSVIDEVVRDYPAESYGLLLWSHGTGWLPSDPRTKAFGQDGSDWMELTGLAVALPDRLFDFILFDACYMGCVEVAYALRNKTNYLITSPTEVLENGFPYNKIVPYFWGGEEDYRELCRKYYDHYNSMSGNWRSATVSLVKTEHLQVLAEITQNILNGKDEQIKNLDRSKIQGIDRRGSLYYWYDVLYDFDDYIHQLASSEQYEVFKQRLRQVIVFEAHTESFFEQVFFRKFCGLGCYIPQTEHPGLNQFYETQDWTKAVY